MCKLKQKSLVLRPQRPIQLNQRALVPGEASRNSVYARCADSSQQKRPHFDAKHLGDPRQIAANLT